MPTLWENVLTLAHEVDSTIAKGLVPEEVVVARLARAVLEFQGQVLGKRLHTSEDPPSPPAPPADADAGTPRD